MVLADRSGVAGRAAARLGAKCQRNADGDDGYRRQQAGRSGAVDARSNDREGLAHGNCDKVRHTVIPGIQAHKAGIKCSSFVLIQPALPALAQVKSVIFALPWVILIGPKRAHHPPDFSRRKACFRGVAASRLSRSVNPIYCRLTMMFYRLFTRQFISGREVCLGVFLCRFLVALRRD